MEVLWFRMLTISCHSCLSKPRWTSFQFPSQNQWAKHSSKYEGRMSYKMPCKNLRLNNIILYKRFNHYRGPLRAPVITNISIGLWYMNRSAIKFLLVQKNMNIDDIDKIINEIVYKITRQQIMFWILNSKVSGATTLSLQDECPKVNHSAAERGKHLI